MIFGTQKIFILFFSILSFFSLFYLEELDNQYNKNKFNIYLSNLKSTTSIETELVHFRLSVPAINYIYYFSLINL